MKNLLSKVRHSLCSDLSKLLDMAEIHVEPKKNSTPVWIWIVLALLVIGALAYFLTRNNNNTDQDNGAGTQTNTTSFLVPSTESFYQKVA